MKGKSLVLIFVFFAFFANAQEPTCGTSFITSEKLGLPLSTCTISEINEDGSRGDPIHVYGAEPDGSDRINPDGSETIHITAAIFVELQAAGAYEIHCTDSMKIESLPAIGGRCPRPGTPEIRND